MHQQSLHLPGLRAGYFFSAKHLFWPVLVLALGLCWFAGLEYRALFKPDEGRYADIPLAMLQTGDWITPRLNGLKYFEKPPLQYWATAIAFKVFGPDEWTARLWTAGLGFLGIFFSAWAAARLWPQQSRLRSVLLLASAWGYFAGAQILTLDMGLSFFLNTAVFAFLLAMRAAPQSGPERNWMLLAWAAMALALLSKGLVGLVLPALTLTAYMLVQRDWRPLKRLHWCSGSALFLLIAAPWFVLVQQANPEFFNFFFIREHFQRFVLPDHDRQGPWWFFIAVLALGMLPWASLIPRALRAAWQARDNGFNADRFLVLWALVTLVFFSVSQSKLPAYILPILPALQVLLSRHWSGLSERARREPLWLSALFAVVLGVLALGLHRMAFAAPLGELAGAYQVWLAAAAIALTVGVHLAWRFRDRPHAYIAALAFGNLLALQCVFSGAHSVDEYYSAERIFDRMAAQRITLSPDVPFYSVTSFDHSVPFYFGRPLTLVDYKGEMAQGVAAEPGKYVPSVGAFIKRWGADRQAYAIMPIEQYQKLERLGLPMRVLERDVRRVIVARS